MRREPKRVRLAEVMRYLQGNPKTTKEIAKDMRVHYITAHKYLVELLLQEQIEVHETYTKPIRYRKKK
jgi:response regulator of citrate/malate metabolism